MKHEKERKLREEQYSHESEKTAATWPCVLLSIVNKRDKGKY
jgi:hypothetical protein